MEGGQSGRQGCKQEAWDVDGGLCVWLLMPDFVGERSEGDQSPGGRDSRFFVFYWGSS